MVTSTKDEGNTLFKKGQHKPAIQRYTAAASFAIQRPPWESSQLMREELSTIMSNRSAAFCEAHDFVAALADAETVIQIRRNWSKGHFRKAKALHGLGHIAEACDAVRFGLSFEPNNQELAAVLAELLREEKKSGGES
jgi:translocation protein SEC72